MDSVAQLFKALSEPVRLRIISLLLHGERCVCDIMAVLKMPQSTVSRHLAYLKNAGWVEGERRGVWMYYRMAESSSVFHSDLLGLLKSHLPATDAGQADADRLHIVLENDKQSCS